MRFIFHFLFPAIILASCATSDITFPKEFKGDQVIVSSGGGFTGQWTSWYLLSDGRLFKKAGLGGTPVFSARLTRGETKECLDLVRGLDLENRPFNHPGNLTWSLEWIHDGVNSQVKWGDPMTETPKEYQSAYSSLISIFDHQTK